MYMMYISAPQNFRVALVSVGIFFYIIHVYIDELYRKKQPAVGVCNGSTFIIATINILISIVTIC